MFNLNKTVLKIVTRLDNAYSYDVQVEKILSDEQLSYWLKGGFAISLLLELSQYLNFSYDLVTDAKLNLAYRFDLASNYSVDLYAATYSLTPQRALFLDPTFIIGISKLEIFLNRGFESSTKDLITSPIESAAWLCLLAIILLFSSVMVLCLHLLDKSVKMGDGLFHILYTFLLKGSPLNLVSTTCKILIWTASMTTVIVATCYSAKIVSIAAVQKFSIKSLADFVNSDFEVGAGDGNGNASVVQEILNVMVKERVNPLITDKLIEKMSESNFEFESFDKSIAEVEARPFGYIVDEETAITAIRKVIGHLPCDWGTIPFSSVPWSMFMRKASKFRPAINYGIQRLSETGIVDILAKRWIPRNVGCFDEGGFQNIGILQTRTAFLIFGIGIGVSLVTILMEVITAHYHRNVSRILIGHNHKLIGQIFTK